METHLDNRQYTRVQRKLHWWVACLIPVQYLGQSAMRSAMERVDAAKTPSLLDFLITTGHSLIGLGVLILIVWRLKLRQQNPVPVAISGVPAGVAVLARAWHLSLYFVVVLMALTGILSYYTNFDLANRAHELGKWVLGTLVIGHILAGLAHWLILKDQVLQGMLVQRRDADTIRVSDQSSD